MGTVYSAMNSIDVQCYNPSVKITNTRAYIITMYHAVDIFNKCRYVYAHYNIAAISRMFHNSDTDMPMYIILMGTINRIVNRSSNTASIFAFWYTHVSPNPAALSILNSTPALVGAAKREIMSRFLKRWNSSPVIGNANRY